MLDIYQQYCDPHSGQQVARFLTIYIEEAHARDEWYLPDTPGGRACIYNHRSMQDRLIAARRFVEDLQFPVETVCDSWLNQADERYAAWPERLYIIRGGRVVYQGGFGPFDYKLAEVQDWLVSQFGARGKAISRR